MRLGAGVGEAVGGKVLVGVGVSVGDGTGVAVAGAAVRVGIATAEVQAASPSRRANRNSVFFKTECFRKHG